MSRRRDGEEGAIPFVVIGLGALVGTLGVAWTGQEWAQTLVGEAGGELTVWVLRGAFWTLDLVGAQAAAEPVSADWYTPVLEGPALPLVHLAALVTVAALVAETVSGVMQGNSVRIGQAVLRAVIAGMLATAGASLLLAVGGALSQVGRAALAASGTSADAPLVPLQEVLMETAERGSGSGGAELFVAFLAALVIVLAALSIYFVLAMRPVLLAAVIVLLPLAHALSVWTPLRRTQVRVWSLAFAILLADAAVLTMFAVANTAMGQPEGIDRLIFGTLGLVLAALAPAALARVVGAPELQGAVGSMSRGSRMLALGAGAMALRHGASSVRGVSMAAGGGSGGLGTGVLDGPAPEGSPGTGGPGGGGTWPGGPATGGPGTGGLGGGGLRAGGPDAGEPATAGAGTPVPGGVHSVVGGGPGPDRAAGAGAASAGTGAADGVRPAAPGGGGPTGGPPSAGGWRAASAPVSVAPVGVTASPVDAGMSSLPATGAASVLEQPVPAGGWSLALDSRGDRDV